MVRENPKRKELRQNLKRRAVILYNEGMTLREVGDIIGKSYEWVRGAVDEILNGKENDGT